MLGCRLAESRTVVPRTRYQGFEFPCALESKEWHAGIRPAKAPVSYQTDGALPVVMHAHGNDWQNDSMACTGVFADA